MMHRPILKSASVVLVVFGIAFIFFPQQAAALYKTELNLTGVYNTMLLGSFCFGVAVIDWGASAWPVGPETRSIIIGNLVLSCIGFLVTVTQQLTVVSIASINWINVALFFVFALLFGLLYLSNLGKTANRSVKT